MVEGRREAADRTCRSATAAGAGSAAIGEHSWPHTTAVVVHGLQVAKASRRRAVPRHARARRRVAEALSGRRSAQAEERRRAKTSRGRPRPTTSTRSSTWSWSTPARRTTRCASSSIATDERLAGLRQGACSAWRCTSRARRRSCDDDPDRTSSSSSCRTTRTKRPTSSCPKDNYWWYWYGSEIEANAYYLKLLSRDEAEGRAGAAAGEVPAQQPQARHLLEQHPRHGATASKRSPTTSRPAARPKPDMTVEVWLDGEKQKEVKINEDNLFTLRQQVRARRRRRERRRAHESKSAAEARARSTSTPTSPTSRSKTTSPRPASK